MKSLSEVCYLPECVDENVTVSAGALTVLPDGDQYCDLCGDVQYVTTDDWRPATQTANHDVGHIDTLSLNLCNSRPNDFSEVKETELRTQTDHVISCNGPCPGNFTPNTTFGPKPRKTRTFTRAQRQLANIRERRRMSNLKTAFGKLRDIVPTLPYERRLTRIETLKLATEYIIFMTDILNGGDQVNP
ncbi:uncharacterized protein LOC144433992 [Glandiceps talaboti]